MVKRKYTPWNEKTDAPELKKTVPHCQFVTEIMDTPYFRKRGLSASTIERQVNRLGLREQLGSVLGKPSPRDRTPVKRKTAIERDVQEILDLYTPDQIRLLKKGRFMPGQTAIPAINFSGQRIRILATGDPHFCSIFYGERQWAAMIEVGLAAGCDFMTVSGDVTDGWSKRDDHITELTHVTYDAQRDYAIGQLAMWPKDMYLIDGNHDRYWVHRAGAWIVKDICEAIGKRAHFLGSDEGDISLKGKASLKLWHGRDAASAYAHSYRPQNIVERTFTGGEKPNVLFIGHGHKYFHFFPRHVHTIGTAAMCSQSKYMRGSLKANHYGFTIVDVWVNKDGVAHCKPDWHPFYA
jgi:hypothetical protein